MSKANFNLMNALASLKRADPAAYDSILAKLNVDRWNDIAETDADAVILQCHAITSGLKLSVTSDNVTDDDDVEDADAEQPSESDHNPLVQKKSNPFVPRNVQAELNGIAAKVFGKAVSPNDYADAAGGATSNADAMNRMGKFGNAARRVKPAE